MVALFIVYTLAGGGYRLPNALPAAGALAALLWAANSLRTCLSALARRNGEAVLSLEASEERFRSVVQAATDAIICLDAAGNVVFWNPAAEKLFGYSEEAVVGRPITMLIPERCLEGYTGEMDRLASAEDATLAGWTRELAGVRKDGSEIPLEVSLSRWRTRDETFFTVVARDITGRRLMEERLLRAERLETVGRIAGRVAHDFNNLLLPLMAGPDLIEMELPEGHPALRHCSAMREAARQMVEINEDLLALGRRDRVDEKPVDVNRLVRRAVAQLSDRLESVTVEMRLSADLAMVSGSAGQLLRAIVNLLCNARDAMQGPGTITIETANVHLERGEGRGDRAEEGEYVRLAVADTGGGIPPEIRDRIFEPFFTTKKADGRRGSGLGLSVVRAIVEDHHGRLELDSVVGEGTTFTLYLPARSR